MVRRLLLAIVTTGIVVAAPFSNAQVPEPAAELAKFDRMVGSWEGKGVTSLTPDGPKMEWTAVAVVSKPLGGFVVQDDVHIDVGDALPAPIIFRTIHTWDRHRQRFVYYSLSNVMPATHGVEFWVGNDRLVSTTSSMVEGTPSAGHTVTDLGKDEYRFVMYQSTGGAPFFAQVTGEFQRSDKTLPAIEKTADMVLASAGEELQALRPECGSWKLQGWFRPIPGAEKVTFSGVEEVRPILGGQALLGIVRGDPMPGAPQSYEEHFYVGWDAEENAYLSFSHSNYGMAGHSFGYGGAEGPRVYVGHAMEEGVLSSFRMLRNLAEDANTAKLTVDRFPGTEPAERMFEADYKRVPEKTEKTEKTE